MCSDEKLMLAVRQGNPQAFEQIVLRYQASAWNTAYRFLGDPAEAQDLAQEAFLKILASADRYQPTAGFQTYLYKVVIRLCIDHARKRHPAYGEGLTSVEDNRPTAPEQIAKRETEEAIHIALGMLPPKQRMALVLKYFEGLTTRQIASAMRTSTKAVERLLSRGRKNLEPLLSHFLEK